MTPFQKSVSSRWRYQRRVMISSSGGCCSAVVSARRPMICGASSGGAVDDGVDLLRAIGPVRVLQQRGQVAIELLVGPGLALQDQRLVEIAVAQLAGLVGDHRVAALGGELEPVEHAAELVADLADELSDSASRRSRIETTAARALSARSCATNRR